MDGSRDLIPPAPGAPLIDPYQRAISYLRVSVTDRCDFRCIYCMAEDMTFLPKAEILSLEELDRLCSAFVKLGVRKLRLTGGEPLVRRNIMSLFRALGRHVEIRRAGRADRDHQRQPACEIRRGAARLRRAPHQRVGRHARRRQVRRDHALGPPAQVMEGLEAAKAAGLAVKINMVALKGVNEDELDRMVEWCGAQGHDLTIIEVMPMGDIGPDRLDQYLPLSMVRARLAQRWTLEESDYRTGGPARYVTVEETGRRIGFITPLTHNFCESCNRVRLTCTGTLYMCLGQEDAADLRAPLRASDDDVQLEAAIREAIGRKPKGHDFMIDRRHAAPRSSAT